MKVLGRLPWSSNASFLVDLTLDGDGQRAVYKPARGERPLWDYPPALYRRERGVYLVSEILGWGLVPETVLRDGEFGEGSVQRFVSANFEEHYFSLLENARYHRLLRTIAAFDVVVNNGDRKSGHFLLDHEDSRIWAIDHGLCLHTDYKLRTVAWDFAGQPLPAELVPDLARLAAQLLGNDDKASDHLFELTELLLPDELAALGVRTDALARRPVFPFPQSSHAYPWPLI